MPQENNDFEKIKLNAELLYKTLDQVYCPFFKEKIMFNSLGLEHLKFKQPRKARLEQDQYMRFKLLNLAPMIIGKSGTVQGIWETKGFEQVRTNKRSEYVLKEVIYYEFIAVVKNSRAKILVKQIENGEKFFWSIVPFWKTDSRNKKRILHTGYPEQD